MFTASWMTYQRKRAREKRAAMRIAAKIEVRIHSRIFRLKLAVNQACRKELEEAEKTDEEDIQSDDENGKEFLNICKLENEKIKAK